MSAPTVIPLPAEHQLSLPPDLHRQRQLGLTVPCAHCRQMPGRACVGATPSGARRELRLLHTVRTRAAERARTTVDAITSGATPPTSPQHSRRTRRARTRWTGHATRPLLYLDLTGPLHPSAAPARPQGFRTFWMSPPTAPADAPVQVWLNPSHGPHLRALADRFDLVWASRWGHDANTRIRPLLGLPLLPVLRWQQDPAGTAGDTLRKGQALLEHARGRPFAWVDPQLPDTVRDLVADHHPGPQLLHYADPARGLTDTDFITLHAALAYLSPARFPAAA